MSDGEKVCGIPLPKFCRYCNKTKQSYEFSKMKLSPDGLQYKCKQCVAEYRRENIERLRELSKVARKNRLQKDPGHERKRYAKMMSDHKNQDSLVVDEETIRRLEDRLASETKYCKGCDQTLPLSNYYVRIRMGTQIDVRTLCKKCHNEETTDKASKSIRSPKHVLTRCKRSSIKNGYEFDLTLDFITELVNQPCSYCGSDVDQITVDRKDSSKGYIMENSTACCLRCNLTKSDMPYEAWLVVAPGMKSAREMGLFGDWSGRRGFIESKKIEPEVEQILI